MDIDTLLDQANPTRAMTLREHSEIDRLIDAVGPRRRRRHKNRWLVGVIALAGLVLTGGATAVAATGILHHPIWYDAASDWSSKGRTVDRIFTVNGQRHSCTVTFTLTSTYNGTGTPDFKAALGYFHKLDPLKVTPDPQQVQDYIHADWSGQGDPPPRPSEAFANQTMWLIAVTSKIADHLTALGLDPSHVSLETRPHKCDVQP